MHVNLLLAGPRTSFFEGALPEIRPYQTTNHVSHQEAIHPTDQGRKANLTQPNQRGFRSVTTGKRTVTVVGPGCNTCRTACVHAS